MTTWTRPCACGTDVTADPDDPTPGVRAHNESDAHRAWRRAMGYEPAIECEVPGCPIVTPRSRCYYHAKEAA